MKKFNQIYEEIMDSVQEKTNSLNNPTPWENTYKYYIIQDIKINNHKSIKLLSYGSDDRSDCIQVKNSLPNASIISYDDLKYYRINMHDKAQWVDPTHDYTMPDEDYKKCMYCNKPFENPADAKQGVCGKCANELNKYYNSPNKWKGD